ncbi:MAG: hypothetical protein ACI4Q3_00260 [Kiritimatiellia bacterium]
MKISGTAGLVATLVGLAAAGGGTFYFRNVQETRRQELQQKARETRLKEKEEARREAEANEKAKTAEARAAEAKMKTAQAEKERAERQLDAKKQEAANEKARQDAAVKAKAQAEAERAASEAAKAQAEAATVRAQAEKAAADAKAKAEALALRRASEERQKAEAERERALAAKAIADAALAKSENDRKAAEANASAEHDRKLRMYKRAETSRAEMLELQRAEKLLAQEEAGVRVDEDEDGTAGAEPAAPDAPPASNAVVTVAWPETSGCETPAQAKVSSLNRMLDDKAAAVRRQRARQHVAKFETLIDQALKEQRPADAAYYRKTLASLVPEYVSVYAELVEEAHAAGREDEAGRLCTSLMALPPDWARMGVIVALITRNEAYYSRLLAGRVSRDEFVKAFRKLYDQARRDKGERDERDEKVAHICSLLATYVPDYERNPEWK